MNPTVYVYMTDEGVDVWRPVDAEVVERDVYRLLGAVPDDEVWQFQPNELVRCETRWLSGGDCLVAVERVQTKQL
jgi:hypothetical protein